MSRSRSAQPVGLASAHALLDLPARRGRQDEHGARHVERGAHPKNEDGFGVVGPIVEALPQLGEEVRVVTTQRVPGEHPEHPVVGQVRRDQGVDLGDRPSRLFHVLDLDAERAAAREALTCASATPG